MRDFWGGVVRELDEWADEKRVAQFWWRDDDAQDTSTQLKSMLAVARQFDVAIGLSVIPVGLKARLVAALGIKATFGRCRLNPVKYAAYSNRSETLSAGCGLSCGTA